MIGLDISFFEEVRFIVVVCYVESLHLLEKKIRKKLDVSLLRYVGVCCCCFFFSFSFFFFEKVASFEK